MFLPDPARRGELDFVFAKSLPYRRRVALIAVLLAAGFVLQAIVHLLVGAAALLAATLLAVVRGFSNVPAESPGPVEWRAADRAQLENILALDRRSRQWDESLLDVTCVAGAATFVLVAGVVAGGAWLLWRAAQGYLAAAWALDGAVLLLPHWITGVRRILTNAPLTVKAKHLLAVIRRWEQIRRDGEVMTPQMLVKSLPDGDVPIDVKSVLQIEPLGENFLGVQTQAVLNRVQGRDYPYLYCVLVARPALGMLEALGRPAPPKGIVAEPKREGDVDIVVVRRHTTKTSGYHTPPEWCRKIFECALGEARRLAT